MNAVSWLFLTLILAFCVWVIVRQVKRGGAGCCSGCSGGCDARSCGLKCCKKKKKFLKR